MILLDHLWHRAAVLALGYLILGVRGLLLALVIREALTLVERLLRWWATTPPRQAPQP